MKKPDIKFIELVAVLLAGIGLFAIPNPLVQLLGKLTVLGSFLYALWVFLPWLKFMEEAKKIPPLFIHMLYGAVIMLVLIGAGFAVYRYVAVKSVNVAGVEENIQKIPSIAVLPFDDMSPGKDQEWFCDGIAEEIINTLTFIDGLSVIARTSSFYFKDKEFGIQDMIKELDIDIDYVLEGSVMRIDDDLRIMAQLIRVSDQVHVWSEK
ncbi:hypothetical protein ACFL47_09525 [Candidatus Latescibacterota bacterium]